MRIRLRSIEVLLALMESGSATGASKILNISQPAVSKALRRAEDELGFAMFHRRGMRLRPTEEARQFYTSLLQLNAEFDQVRERATRIRQGQINQITVMAIPALSMVLLPTIISEFSKRRPDIAVNIRTAPGEHIVELLENGAADLGFAYLAPSHGSLVAIPFAIGELVCIAPQGSRLLEKTAVTPGDVARERLIFFAEEQRLLLLARRFLARAGALPDAKAIVNLVSTAWSMVASGNGVSIVDNLSRFDQIFPTIGVRPLEPAIPLTGHMLFARNTPTAPQLEEFLLCVTAVCGSPERYPISELSAVDDEP